MKCDIFLVLSLLWTFMYAADADTCTTRLGAKCLSLVTISPTADPAVKVDPVNSEDSSLPPKHSCGFDDSDRIIGGDATQIDEFPWMARLGYRTPSKRITYQCGGALINRRYVLTAAHCVFGEIEQEVGPLVTVRLGEYNIHQDLDCVNGVCADEVQDVDVHEGYSHSGYTQNPQGRQDDIALVRLAKRVTISPFVQPICLVDENARLEVGKKMVVAGWGRTLAEKNSAVKLKVSVPIFDHKQCANMFRRFRIFLSDKQICAGGELFKDSCRGDSGGPLMRKGPGGIWEAVGLVSFGNNCGRKGWPSVYTSVAKYEDWIRSTLHETNV